MFKNAVIMAAGRGERMLPVTNYVPKAMVRYEGKELIKHSIDNLQNYKIKTHVTVGHRRNMLAPYLMEWDNDISSIINTLGNGNAWWIYNTLLSNLNEPIILLTCDNIMQINFESVYQEYCEHNQPACMIIPTTVNSSFEGDFISHINNKITTLSRDIKSNLFASGCQIINPYQINMLTEKTENFYKVWYQLIEKQMLFCSNIQPSEWKSIDSLSQLVAYESTM